MQAEGVWQSGAAQAYVTILFTEVDFLQAINPGLD
jgi:hypothetical protein